MKSISIRKAKAEEEEVKLHTQFQRLGFRDSVKVKWNHDGPGMQLEQTGAEMVTENMRSDCRLQIRGAVQGQSGHQQHVIAHHRGGSLREARLARCGIREHEVFSGHGMRGPGTRRAGVTLAFRCLVGGKSMVLDGKQWAPQ